MSGFKTEESAGHRGRARRAEGRRLQAAARDASPKRSKSSARRRSSTPRAPAPPTTSRTQAVENLPTISRSIVDIARTSPYFNPIGPEQRSAGAVGRRPQQPLQQHADRRRGEQRRVRLAPSGTPGGETEAQPISLDAIQELQLVVSPYDVRQGGFSGGGINAITKSGTQPAAAAPAYYFGRNQDWVGESPTGTKIGAVQGSAVRRQRRRADRARTRRSSSATSTGRRKDNPSGFSVGGSGQQFGRAGGSRPLPQHPAEPATATIRAATGRVHPDEQQRQGFRPRRLQPRRSTTS